jgi:hypothetical protein
MLFSSTAYHVWIRVNNAPKTVKEYEDLAKRLNKLLFNGKACSSCINPAQLMRAPNEVNKETGELQEVVMNKRNIVEANFDSAIVAVDNAIKSNAVPNNGLQDYNNTSSNVVQFYFNLCKNDHDKTNGGRGKLIFTKARKQKEKGWTPSQCRELIELLCKEWDCPDKIKRLQSYF